jgi:hypothetical protein
LHQENCVLENTARRSGMKIVVRSQDKPVKKPCTCYKRLYLIISPFNK